MSNAAEHDGAHADVDHGFGHLAALFTSANRFERQVMA